ncbi:MAG TPA: V-type ATPase subunit [Candidatus Atribacteria bacterium]|nr:V-type ATPase subunit [Candidatus Atribacteria bacterium]HPT79186.1 V-type ATPase subunit [Candidatus Atribacteria bacterium]
MSPAISYAAVNTKLRAILGLFLSNEDYMRLISMDSVADIARYLKQTHYSQALEGVSAEAIHRGELEVILRRYSVDLLMRLRHYFKDEARKFLNVLYMRFEVEDLKLLIRALFTGQDLAEAGSSLVYIGRYGDLDIKRLISSKSFSELVDSLKGSPYYPYLYPLTLKDNTENQFRVEMALDLAYAAIYKRHMEKLTPAEQEMIIRIQGMRADLLNLQLIYRGIKFYRLPGDILLNYTLDFNGSLSHARLKELCQCRDEAELVEKMRNTRYNFLFDHKKTRDIFMERRMNRYLYYKLLKIRRMNRMDIVQSVIFFDLLEIEIRDIITIVENIRYHNEDPERIKSCLIRSL